jgi:transcriptional regulator with XRE-family HTH domain
MQGGHMPSPDEQLSRILVGARKTAGVSRQALAKRVGYSESYIGNVETGVRRVTPDLINAYASALGVPMLAEIWETDDMQRRALIAALARTGAIGLAGPAALSEAIRISILDRFSAPESWTDRMAYLGEQFIAAPASTTHHTIGVHLLALLDERTVTPETRDAAARLMLLRATTTANLGDIHGAKDWYRAACKTAKDSGDKRLMTWVYGRHATRRGYENATPGDVLAGAAEIDCTEAHLASSHAYARLGRRREAIAALDDARRVYPQTDQAEGTVYAFQPYRLQLAEAYTWALFGDVTKTERLIACISIPGPLARFEAQRGLTVAVAMARAGDRESALIQRDAVMREHPDEQTSMILTSMIEEINR